MSTLWVVGDSTLSSFDDKYYYPRYGYGTKLGCYLNSKVQVLECPLEASPQALRAVRAVPRHIRRQVRNPDREYVVIRIEQPVALGNRGQFVQQADMGEEEAAFVRGHHAEQGLVAPVVGHGLDEQPE